ncbi:MAG: hypothetical protein OEY51_12465, partial [Cyclobacteriaceae bacterium]|nr:hypothetical protein [Cyclobacteriaceae bacterium]
MKSLNRKNIHVKTVYPDRIIQFGTGNFLRAHFDWMVDVMNE